MNQSASVDSLKSNTQNTGRKKKTIRGGKCCRGSREERSASQKVFPVRLPGVWCASSFVHGYREARQKRRRGTPTRTKTERKGKSPTLAPRESPSEKLCSARKELGSARQEGRAAAPEVTLRTPARGAHRCRVTPGSGGPAAAAFPLCQLALP